MKRQFDIVEVEWVDAASINGWSDISDLSTDNCLSCGYLVKEEKDYICIAAAVSGEQTNAVICIPKRWILKRRKL